MPKKKLLYAWSTIVEDITGEMQIKATTTDPQVWL